MSSFQLLSHRSLFVLCSIYFFNSCYRILPISSVVVNEVEKVNVTVYYETLCYQSTKLIHSQLYPTWLALNSYFNLQFIPYGKSVHFEDQKNGKIQFLCHHGPQECYGNRIQACALVNLNEEQSVQYIACFMTYNNNYPFKTNCFQETNDDPKALEKFQTCVNTTEGDKVLAEFGELTLSVDPRFSSVPAISFNQIYAIDVDLYAQKHFKSALCQLINKPDLAACNS